MKDFAPDLIQRIQKHRDRITEIASSGPGQASPTEDYRDDTPQMMNAFFLLLIEALEERGRATRDMHTETLIPGLRDAGFPLDIIIGGAMRVFVGMTGELVPDMPKEHQKAAAEWLADFSGEYVADVVRVFQTGK